MKVSLLRMMWQKSFHKGIEQLVQEGAVQLYKNYQSGESMLGAVGQLQFEVFLNTAWKEYNAEVVMNPQGVKTVRCGKRLRTGMNRCRQVAISAKDRFVQPQSFFEKMTLPSAGLRTSLQT